jgi:hypothetical protein
MSVPEICGTLLASAQRDLDLLESNFENTRCADEVFGFHAQQATEKTFKAWLNGQESGLEVGSKPSHKSEGVCGGRTY